jgi:hypothetical protein
VISTPQPGLVKRRWENLPAEGLKLKDLDREEILRTRELAMQRGRISPDTSKRVGDILDRLGLRAGGLVTTCWPSAPSGTRPRWLEDPKARLADGTPMSVRTALQLINRFFSEDDFDADTRFCLHWYEEHAWSRSTTSARRSGRRCTTSCGR